jgi:hypothetical protein
MASIILKLIRRERSYEVDHTESSHNTFKREAVFHNNFNFPCAEEVISDINIGIFFNGNYQKQRLVISEDYVIFAEVDQQEIIDFIPIADIVSVDDLDGITADSGAKEDQSQANIASLETVASTLSAFQIRTIPCGYNCGRKYCLQAGSDSQCEELIKLLDKLVSSAHQKRQAKSTFQRSQDAMRKLFNSSPFQMGSAALIFLNFFISAVDAQLWDQLDDNDGARTPPGQVIDIGNNVLTLLFAAELLVNLHAHWLREFLSSWMNIWDVIIVGLSVSSLGPLDIGMPVTILRFFRVVRILRALKIFTHLPQLRKITSALSHSIIPMLNAFLIVLIVMAIYAIIGVTYFRDQVGNLHTGTASEITPISSLPRPGQQRKSGPGLAGYDR